MKINPLKQFVRNIKQEVKNIEDYMRLQEDLKAKDIN